MKITVHVQDLIDEIEEGLKNYKKEYVKLIILYTKKHEKYQEYLGRHLSDIATGTRITPLKSSPFTPSWLRDNFVDILDALKAHREPLIIMDDREYNQARHGIERLREDISETTVSLNAISYE